MEPSLLPDPTIFRSRSRNLLSLSSSLCRRFSSILLVCCSPNLLRAVARRSFSAATRDGSTACARSAILPRRSCSNHIRWMKCQAEPKPISKCQPYRSKKRHTRLKTTYINSQMTFSMLAREESAVKTPSMIFTDYEEELRVYKRVAQKDLAKS